jgi:uncharacterized protein YjaZ
VGIERTDKWLEDHFDEPIKICSRFISSERVEDESELYDYLGLFGMYRPSRMAKKMFLQLKKADTWSKAEHILDRYQRKWQGPDVPVYIFPINERKNNKLNGKSGVSFQNSMFLFLSPLQDEKELEALVVHEYHHVCRLNRLVKPISDYTLLDSIVMEGFAEHIVTKYCGREYNMKCLSDYTNEELDFYWKKHFKMNIQTNRMEPLHDALLFGIGRYPPLLGYAVGYWLIECISKKHHFTIKETFSMKTEEMLDLIDTLN